MTRADLAELEERVDRLEAMVAENSHRIQVHATIGWALFILWLLSAVAGTIVLARLL